jgi:hypothetical protein
VSKLQPSTDSSAFNLSNIVASILSNLLTTMLEHHGQKLEGTRLESALKFAGIIKPDFNDYIRNLLKATLEHFFNRNPLYQRDGIADFFSAKDVSQALSESILNNTLVDQQRFTSILHNFLITDADAQGLIRRKELQLEQVVTHFFDAYRYVRRQGLDPKQIGLLQEIEELGQNFMEVQDRLTQLIQKVDRKLSAVEIIKHHFRLVELDDFPIATPQNVNDFYSGRYLLEWGIIKAEGLIERDQRKEVMEVFSSAPTRLETICITGQMGDGKSSFAWDLAAKVATKLNCWLLQVVHPSAQAWIILENALLKNGHKPVIVLVDDLFRDSSFVDALRKMRNDLPIRIIATSRLNEIPNHNVPPGFQTVRLNPPSAIEKQQLLERLGKSDLTDKQRRRLFNEKNWLVMMIELTSSKILPDFIDQLLGKLRSDDEAYRAYEYICLAGQFDLFFPEDLLNLLDEKNFYRLTKKASLSGLVFSELSNQGTTLLRPSHAMIAETAFEIYNHNPISFLGRILFKIRPDSQLHREFFYSLTLNLSLRGHLTPIQTLFRAKAEGDYFRHILNQSRHIEVFNNVRPLLEILKDDQLLKSVLQNALETIPQNGSDWIAKLNYVVFEAQYALQNNLDQVQEWLEINDDRAVLERYLVLVDKYGENEHIDLALKTGFKCFETPYDGELIAGYLNLLRKGKSQDQIDIALKNVNTWFETQYNGLAFIAYINLLSARGSIEQIRSAIESMRSWVEVDEEKVLVLRGYLVLVRTYGSLEQVKVALSNAHLWLNAHNDSFVYENYIKLLKDRGSALWTDTK